MTSKKIPLAKIQVKSFTTSKIRGGLVAFEAQGYNTVYSGVCTCLMDCDSRADLSCPDGCPVRGATPDQRDL